MQFVVAWVGRKINTIETEEGRERERERERERVSEQCSDQSFLFEGEQ